MSFERLDDLGKAGFLVGLTGGLLAVVPPLESLLTFSTGWQGPMVLMLLSLGMIAGAMLAVSGSVALGGVVTAVTGITIALHGPLAPGIIGVVGGSLLYAANEQRRTPSEAREERAQEPRRPTLIRP